MTTEQHRELIQSAIALGHDETGACEVACICEHWDCSPNDVTLKKYDHHGLSMYSVGNIEFAIGTDSMADEACENYIVDSAWAFNASFILSECELPQDLCEPIEAWQFKECEGCNDGILALIKKTCGLESFTKAAVSADGRGHFLSPYDGSETEIETERNGERVAMYIYRIN